MGSSGGSGAEEYRKNIGLVGSVSLLVSAITGPGLIAVPTIFQISGWFPTIAVFFLVSGLSSLGALFLTEAISKYPGNAAFQRNVELTTLVQHFYGPTYHLITQFVLYASMQSINIASVVVSTQAIDRFFVHVAGGTCGFELGVSAGGWLCVNGTTHADAVSPFIGNGTPGTMVLFTLGFLSLICVVVPLATMDLNDNIVIQFVSFLVLFAIVIFWFSIFLADPLTPSLVPAIGPSAGSLVGNVLANYAFVTTVPSWLGVKHPKVGVHRAVLISLGAALVLYMGIGIVGGMWKEISTSSDLLTAIDNMVINIIFPLFTLVTSIPVNIIIIRANLVQAKVCGRGWAMFWAAIFPFLICIPLQTSDSLNVFFSWASLISSSTANFAIPLLIYIFLKNRKSDDIIMHLHPEMSRHTLNTDDPSTMGTDSQDGLDEVSVEMLEEDAKLMTVKVDLAEITATLRDAATSRSGGKRGIGGSSSKGDSMLGSRFIGSKFSVGGNGRRGSVLASMLPEHPPTGLMGNILARAASRNLSDKGSGHRRKSFVDLQMAADLGLSQSNMASMSNIAATNDSSYGGGAMSDLSSIGVGKPATIAEPVQPVTPFPSPPVVSADWKPFSASAREDEDSIKSSGSFSRSSPLHTIMSTSELEVDSDEDAQSNSNATSASVSSTDVASTSGVSQPNKDATETATKTPEAQETQRVASAVYLPRSMKRTINSRAPKEETPATPAAGDAKTSSATPTPAPAAPEPITERDLLPPGIGSLSDLGKPAIALTLTPFDSDTPTDQIGLDGKVRKPPQPPKEPKETSEISAPVSGPASSGASAVTPKGAKQKNASTNQDAGVQQKAKTATKTNHVDQDKANGSPEVSKKGSVQPAPLSQSRSPSAVVSTKPPLAKEANATSKKKEIENGELPPLPTKPSDRGRSPGGGADAPTPDTKQNASNQPVAQPTASQPPYDRPRSRERRSSLERRLSLEQRRSSLPNSGERRSSLPRAGQAGYAGTGPTPPADNRGDIRTIQRRSSKDASGLPLINVDFSGADLDLASSPSSSSPSSSRPAMSMHSSTPTSTTALLPNQGDGPRDGMPPPPPRPSKVPSVAGFYLDPYYRNRLRELQEANPDYPRPDLDGLDALDQVLPEGVKAFQAIPEQLLILHFHPFYWYWNRIVGLFSCFRCCLRLRRGKRVAASLQHGLLTPAPNDADNHAGGKRVEIEPQWVALTALLITLFTTVGAIIWNVVIAVRN